MEQFAAMLPDEKKPMLAKLIDNMKKFFSGEVKLTPTEWKGYKFLPGFEAQTAKYFYDSMELNPDAIYVFSFAKTGTNWSIEIIRQILYGDNAKLGPISKAMPPPFFALEMGNVEKFKVMEHIPLPRRYFASHLPEELVNVEKIKKSGGKIIYIMRNPKDQAVSWYHFVQAPIFDHLRDVMSCDWDQYFTNYTQGKQPNITKEGEWYLDHILGWYKHRDDEDFLFLFFEDIKKDPHKELRRIAEFIGVDLCDERINQIAEATSFDAMKKTEQTNPGMKEKMQTKVKALRKGQVGSWKDTFTVAQSELMDKLVEEKLGQTDIEFTYEL